MDGSTTALMNGADIIIDFLIRQKVPYLFGLCGPGSANLVVALAAAMMDSSAFFAITGNVPTSQFNRGPFQETGRTIRAIFPPLSGPT